MTELSCIIFSHFYNFVYKKKYKTVCYKIKQFAYIKLKNYVHKTLKHLSIKKHM